jgi:hypothetical protein
VSFEDGSGRTNEEGNDEGQKEVVMLSERVGFAPHELDL